jgi:hypothetical protein
LKKPGYFQKEKIEWIITCIQAKAVYEKEVLVSRKKDRMKEREERDNAGYQNLVGKNLIGLDKDQQIAYYNFFNKSNGF